jgi:FemAB-related protein (PEP-CTERM system-associated)
MAVRLQDILTGTSEGNIEIMPLADGGPEWLDYLQSNPAADICQHPAWGHVFAETFGFDSALIVHRTEGRIGGGLPLILFDQRITGKAMVSMPFLNYGGILGDNDTIRGKILNIARSILEKTSTDYMELRHTGQGIGEHADQTVQNRFTFRLDINRPTEDLFKDLKKQLRTRLRKAAKQGMEFYQGQERLDHFYNLFATAMTEHGTPVMPKRFFASILKYLSEYAEMMIAYKDSQPIGGKLVLKFKNRATMTWGCYPNRHKHYLANYYLTWELIQQLAQGPIQLLDFGRSARESGGYTYKANWGATILPIFVDYIAPDASKIPYLKPENIKFRAAVSIWKKMPLGIAKLIGPRLARYFP